MQNYQIPDDYTRQLPTEYKKTIPGISLASINPRMVYYQKTFNRAEDEGFKPPIRLPVYRISSPAHSVTLPIFLLPLQLQSYFYFLIPQNIFAENSSSTCIKRPQCTLRLLSLLPRAHKHSLSGDRTLVTSKQELWQLVFVHVMYTCNSRGVHL